MIESLQSVQGADALLQAYETRDASATKTDFGGWLNQQIEALNQQIVNGDKEVRKLALGEGNLHEVMTRLEQAKLSFELAVQVRNKILESYQEVMRMGI